MSQLEITIGLLCLEIAVMVWLYFQGRKQPAPGEVRLFPYRGAAIFVALLILVTGAHLISLLTGTQLKPRRPKGM